MAERRAQNKWIPNDYDPKKFRTINSYTKHKQFPGKGRHQHEEPEDIFESLKDRPVDAFRRTITVRFEMPFNIWCTGCEKHIGMGVRYNAEKKHMGMYHSTPIFKFRMKCHLCPSYIEIQTDPKNAEYVILSGARKRIETFDPKDAGVIELKDEEEKERLEKDAFYRLEQGVLDKKEAETAAPQIHEIQAFNDAYWKDPYTASQIVRRKFRTEKKDIKMLEADNKELQDRVGLSIPVLPASAEDEIEAKKIQWDEKNVSNLPPSLKALNSLSGGVFKRSKSSSSSKPVSAKEKLKKLVASKRSGDPFSFF